MNPIYHYFFRNFLCKLDPERVHDIACEVMGWAETVPFVSAFLKALIKTDGAPINLFGLHFPNRIGLAAGLDKNGMFPRISSSLGFGHVEVGTVTPEAQPGKSSAQAFQISKSKCLGEQNGV